MDTDFQAYDLQTDDGKTHILVLRKEDNDFCGLFKTDGNVELLAGLIDEEIFPSFSKTTYTLKDRAQSDTLDNLTTINLFGNGTCTLDQAAVSSYALPVCSYEFVGDELVLRAKIDTQQDEDFYGLKNKDVIARFKVIDSETIEFISTEIPFPLYIKAGAIYSTAAFIQPAGYLPRELITYTDLTDNAVTAAFITLDEFPDVEFAYSTEKFTAKADGVQSELIFGMPIWNIILADLTGDGLPEFCANVSFGSGVIDERVIIYDYVNQKSYELSDRGNYDFFMQLENDEIKITQRKYNSDKIITISNIRINGGEVAID